MGVAETIAKALLATYCVLLWYCSLSFESFVLRLLGADYMENLSPG